jgi:hypothetical protein
MAVSWPVVWRQRMGESGAHARGRLSLAALLQHSTKAKPVISSASQISESRKYKVLRSMAFNKRSP